MAGLEAGNTEQQAAFHVYLLKVYQEFVLRLPFRPPLEVFDDVGTLITQWLERRTPESLPEVSERRELMHGLIALLATDEKSRDDLERLFKDSFPWPDGWEWDEGPEETVDPDFPEHASEPVDTVGAIEQGMSGEIANSHRARDRSLGGWKGRRRADLAVGGTGWQRAAVAAKWMGRHRVAVAVGGVLSLLLLGFLLRYVNPPHPSEPVKQEKPAGEPPAGGPAEEPASPVSLEPTRTKVSPERPVSPAETKLEKAPRWTPLGAWSAILAALGLLFSVYVLLAPPGRAVREKRKQAVSKALAELPPGAEAHKLTFYTESREWMKAAELEDAVELLAALRSEGAEGELDVRATLERTLRRGGYPEAILRPHQLPREVVVLVDTHSSNGRWLHRVEPVLRNLRQRGAELKVIRQALRLESGGSLPGRIRHELTLSPASPLLLVSGRLTDLAPRGERAMPWVRELGERRAVLLDLNPVRVAERGEESRLLEALERTGFRRYGWSAAGLHAALTWLGEREPGMSQAGELTEGPRKAEEQRAVELWAYAAALVPDPTWEQLEELRVLLPELKGPLSTPGHLSWLVHWLEERRGEQGPARATHLELTHEEKRWLVERYGSILEPELRKARMGLHRSVRGRFRERWAELAGARDTFRDRVLAILIRQLGAEPPARGQAVRWELRRAYYESLRDGRWGRMRGYRDGASAHELGWLLSPFLGRRAGGEKPLEMPAYYGGLFEEGEAEEARGLDLVNPLELGRDFWVRYGVASVLAMMILLGAGHWLRPDQGAMLTQAPGARQYFAADFQVNAPPPTPPASKPDANRTPPPVSAAIPFPLPRAVVAARPRIPSEGATQPGVMSPSPAPGSGSSQASTASISSELSAASSGPAAAAHIVASNAKIPPTQAPFQMNTQYKEGTNDRPAMWNMPLPSDHTFAMGAPDWDAMHLGGETQHLVKLRGEYVMFETEVTQGQYETVTRPPSGHWTPPWKRLDCRAEQVGPEYPAVCVTWEDATRYADALTVKELGADATCYYDRTGRGRKFNLDCRGYRLPTEAEWEYAARAGGTHNRWAGTNDEVAICTYASIDGCESGYSKVGRLAHNGWGLKDMTGNVWEWVGDWYGDSPKVKSIDEGGPASGSVRVIRGGSWWYVARNARVSKRYRRSSGDSFNYLGFRLSRSLP